MFSAVLKHLPGKRERKPALSSSSRGMLFGGDVRVRGLSIAKDKSVIYDASEKQGMTDTLLNKFEIK
jgi:hypothetical protein